MALFYFSYSTSSHHHKRLGRLHELTNNKIHTAWVKYSGIWKDLFQDTKNIQWRDICFRISETVTVRFPGLWRKKKDFRGLLNNHFDFSAFDRVTLVPKTSYSALHDQKSNLLRNYPVNKTEHQSWKCWYLRSSFSKGNIPFFWNGTFSKFKCM